MMMMKEGSRGMRWLPDMVLVVERAQNEPNELEKFSQNSQLRTDPLFYSSTSYSGLKLQKRCTRKSCRALSVDEFKYILNMIWIVVLAELWSPERSLELEWSIRRP
jgi:hypothetical protein